MNAEPQELADDELEAIAKSGDSSMLRKLTAQERTRLQAIQAKGNDGTNAALMMTGMRAALPIVERGAMHVAISPTFPKTAATVGRVVGGVAPMIGGAMEYGLPGFASGALGAAAGAWSGGKTGWFTGKLLQDVARPTANAAKRLQPFMQAVAPLNIAQGGLDLAQMQEPSRKDIGILGFGRTVNPSDIATPSQPPSAETQRIVDIAKALIAKGMSPQEAVRTALSRQ